MKKSVLLLIAVLLTAGACSVNAVGAENGVCGENLTYEIEDEVLTISGSGDMYNTPYDHENYFDWSDSYDYEIYTSVVLNRGITSIGAYAFEMSLFDSIYIPEGTASIEQGAFEGAVLSSVTLPVSLEIIKEFAFTECDYLTDVYYNGTKEQWNEIEIEDDNEALTSAEIHFAESSAVSDSAVAEQDLTETISSEPEVSEAATSNSDDITVTVNGRALSFDQPPVISEGRTLVPLRVIFEALGASVEWDDENEEICAIKGNVLIAAGINKNKMYKLIMNTDVSGFSIDIILDILDNEGAITEGEIITLDAAPTILNGRTLVPVRAVSEAFDASVSWDDKTRTVSVSTA